MSSITTYPLTHGSTVFSSYTLKDEINVHPNYQRHGDIWTLEKKQLLIDSIINRYDIPKLYFHKLSINQQGYEYAIIDGRQRLETIWKFIDGGFALSKDFLYLKDRTVKAEGMTYSDLGKNYPKIKNFFDSTILPIIVVDTSDMDLIEDMFSRLNEAVPLNAAEKRNAFGGFCINAVNKLARHEFFTKKVKFNNSRYQYREVAIRLLFIESNLSKHKKIVDTKKVYLDAFAKKYRKTGKSHIDQIFEEAIYFTEFLASIFIDNDPLLSAQASIPIYYLVARSQWYDNEVIKLTRKQIYKFQELRKENRRLAEANLEKADFELLEYDRLSQQGTNDATSIKERTRIMLEKI